jgi:hypothetical protein
MPFWKRLFQRSAGAQEPDTRDTTGPARRATVRLPHGRMTFGEVIALPANLPLLVKIKDISLGGLGLLCNQPVPQGTFLAVKLEGANYSRVLRARVIHATAQGNSWLLGCRLIDRLSSEELAALL